MTREASGVRRFTAAHSRESSKIIFDVYPVNFDLIDRFYPRRGGDAFEPSRGAPAVLVGYGHKLMFHSVLVNIIQAGQIAVLHRQFGILKIEPGLPAFGVVHPV